MSGLAGRVAHATSLADRRASVSEERDAGRTELRQPFPTNPAPSSNSSSRRMTSARTQRRRRRRARCSMEHIADTVNVGPFTISEKWTVHTSGTNGGVLFDDVGRADDWTRVPSGRNNPSLLALQAGAKD